MSTPRLRQVATASRRLRLSRAIPWCSLTVALLLAAPLAAQGSAFGIVLSATTRGPIDGATVLIEQDGARRHATLTDRNGFYQIGGIAPGSYTIVVLHIAYSPQRLPLEVAPGQRHNVDFQLEPSVVQLEGMVIGTERGAAIRDFGRQQIRPSDLRLAPVPGGSGDLASYLQTLPGVTTTGDRGGQLFVRGGTSAENLVLVDGIPIYQPFHILGFFSVFPETLVSSADFYPGGFGARYRGRTSSALDVTLRDGDATEYRGVGSISPFVGEVLIEGPLGEGVSWLVSARKSLIEQSSEALLGTRHPIAFESQMVKFTATDGEDLRCSVLGLRTADRGSMDPDDTTSHVSWNNLIGGGRCVASLDRFLRLMEATFSFSSLENSAVSRGSSTFRSKIWQMQHDLHSTSMIGTVPIYVGYQLFTELTDYDLRELYGMHIEDGSVFGINGYAEVSLALRNLEVRPGVVLAGAPRAAIEPRLRAEWQPLGRSSEVVTAGFGLYRQDVAGISDLRDVGSVFTAWIETPDDEPIEALHGMVGWQQAIGGGLTWSLEGYYKRLRHLPIPVWRALAEFGTRLGSADGRSRGADLRVEYRSPDLHLLLGYGYGETEYLSAQKDFATWFGEPVQSYHPPHDRRHQVNFAGSGRLAGFDLSARWQLGSGLPFTRPLGFDEAFDFSEVPHEVWRELGATRLILDRPFNARLPVMHRLDLSVGREFDVANARIKVQAGAVNAYDRRNMFYYDLFSGRRVDQLPLSPFVSLTASLP